MAAHGEDLACQSGEKVRCECVGCVDDMRRIDLSAGSVDGEGAIGIVGVDLYISCRGVGLDGKGRAICREKRRKESGNQAIGPQCSGLVSDDAIAVLGVDV